jgi:hypothetical protein
MKIHNKIEGLKETYLKKDLEMLEDLNEYNQKLCIQIIVQDNLVNILVRINSLNILFNTCYNSVEVNLIHKKEEI